MINTTNFIVSIFSQSMSGGHYTRILLNNAYNFRLSARQSPLITASFSFHDFINWPFFNGLIWTRNRKTTSSRLSFGSNRRSFAFQWSRHELESFKLNLGMNEILFIRFMLNESKSVLNICVRFRLPNSWLPWILMRFLSRIFVVSQFVAVVVAIVIAHASFKKLGSKLGLKFGSTLNWNEEMNTSFGNDVNSLL